MRTHRLGQQIARNTVHYSAQFGWFFALTLIPLAQVVAIEFTMPIWTALLAVAFLGERLGAARIAAVVLGLVGVAVIVRPGLEHVDPGQLIALAAAVGFAISMILVKSLTRTESTVAIIFWMLVVQSVIGIVPALLVWRTPGAAVWPWIVVIALCGTYSHYCMLVSSCSFGGRQSAGPTSFWQSCARPATTGAIEAADPAPTCRRCRCRRSRSFSTPSSAGA